MNNMQDLIGSSTMIKKFTVDDLLFVELVCPPGSGPVHMWWHNNFFTYVLSGETTLKTPRGTYTLKSGDAVFNKKGSVLIKDHSQDILCELLVFMPDDFIKSVINKYNAPVPAITANEASDTVIPLQTDEVLETYFHSLLSYFRRPDPPPVSLLKIKLEELIVTLLSGKHQPLLTAYFSELYASVKTSVREIMEANFATRLSLDEFARLCGRSLSAFKRDFQSIYHTTPGKWLLQKRLEYSRFLLDTTASHLDDICMESGFENRSHFIRVFRDKYGVTPGKYKLQQQPS